MGRVGFKYRLRGDVKIALVTLATCCGVFSPSLRAEDSGKSPSANEQLVDRIAAVVNGHPILYSDVMDKVRTGPLVSISDYPAAENASAYEKALQDAINFELIVEQAHELEIEVPDEQVDQEIQSFLQSRGLTKDGLLEFLAQQGKTFDEYRADFRNQLLVRRFQGRVILPQIKVTDKDLETYFLKKNGARGDLQELTLRVLLIQIPEGASSDVLKAKTDLANEVYAKLKSGMPFPEAVKIYSDDQSARSDGGLMQGVEAKDLAEVLRKPIQALQPGQFTEPLRTPLGFNIILLEKRDFKRNEDFEKQKQQLDNELRTQEMQDQTQHWIEEQRQKTKVQILP